MCINVGRYRNRRRKSSGSRKLRHCFKILSRIETIAKIMNMQWINERRRSDWNIIGSSRRRMRIMLKKRVIGYGMEVINRRKLTFDYAKKKWMRK